MCVCKEIESVCLEREGECAEKEREGERERCKVCAE